MSLFSPSLSVVKNVAITLVESFTHIGFTATSLPCWSVITKASGIVSESGPSAISAPVMITSTLQHSGPAFEISVSRNVSTPVSVVTMIPKPSSQLQLAFKVAGLLSVSNERSRRNQLSPAVASIPPIPAWNL